MGRDWPRQSVRGKTTDDHSKRRNARLVKRSEKLKQARRSLCPTHCPDGPIRPAGQGLLLVPFRPEVLLPAAEGAGKCQSGLSQKRKCPGEAIPVLPDLP